MKGVKIMNKQCFHFLLLKDPKKNLHRTIRMIIPYSLVCILLFLIIGYQKNWTVSCITLAILLLVGLFELLCAKTMASVTDIILIQKAYQNGIIATWLILIAICIYWIILFGFIHSLPLILISLIGRIITLHS